MTPQTLPGFECEAWDDKLSQYMTPPELATHMASLVDLRGKRVLEPSAGSGNLVRAALDAGAAAVDCMDIDQRNGNRLCQRFEEDRDEGRVLVRRGDFLDWTPMRPMDIDVALMNPPWNDGVAAHHILHALEFAPVVVALAPLATLATSWRRDKLWRNVWLERLVVCSERQKYTGDGGSRDDAVFVVSRDDTPSVNVHQTQVSFYP